MNDDEVSAKLDAILEVNRDIRQWLRVMAWDTASATASEALGENPAEYHLYEELDGETSISEVIDNVSIPRRTVYSRLNEWQQAGIVSKVGRGRYEKIASLDSLGIDPPDPNQD